MLFRRTILQRIQRLDPEKDDQRILFLSWYHDFPWDCRKALEFALFRTYAVPSISGLLDSTGEFLQRTQQRYDDTELLIAEFVENGYHSERGRRAIRRMNQLHHRFHIPNEDYLYVLSTFVFEPRRWINRFGWRPYSEHERLATWFFWRNIGRMMNIRDIPSSYEDFERFNVEYERAHFRYSETNRRIGEATRELFLSWYLPRPLRKLGRPAVHSMMDEPLREAFGFPRPPAALQRSVQGLLRARSLALRAFPERLHPKLVTRLQHKSYPAGYEIEQLGPPGTQRERVNGGPSHEG
ncbi:oxygenase MpaB family protein [Archangium lipolyticum]|uniref:oxygenase MpaB family protein n=1 Tax=Archangium lipolyticum TaxID=2970465 RepID=UPI002149AD6B|nr:oxygenase MpaB family protein [Archangium lipolyticum]